MTLTRPHLIARQRDAHWIDVFDNQGARKAHCYLGNPLASDDISWLTDHQTDLPTICWSGTIASSLFEAHPHTWMSPGVDRFMTFRAAALDHLEQHGGTISVRPHARHVLCDAQSAERLIRTHPHEQFGITLDLASLFETSMIEKATDHLQRAFDLLAPSVHAVWLSDTNPAENEGDLPTRTPWKQGSLPGALVDQLIESQLPSQTPLILDQQLD